MKMTRMFIGSLILGAIALVNEDFAELLLMSVVCTLGAGLLFWMPIAWTIGAIIIGIFFPSMEDQEHSRPTSTEQENKRTSIPHTSTSKRMPLTPHEQERMAFKTFFNKAKAKGMSSIEIKQKLIEAGWTEEQIRELWLYREHWS